MKPMILAGLVFGTLSTGAAFAQSAAPIQLADIVELSGGGATVGTNWKNGIDLAIEEINAGGGILGHRLEVTHADSQSNPGVALTRPAAPPSASSRLSTATMPPFACRRAAS